MPLSWLAVPLSRQRCRCLVWCGTWPKLNVSGSGNGLRARYPIGISPKLSLTATSMVPLEIEAVVDDAWSAWHDEVAFAEQFARDTDLNFVGRDGAGQPISLRELLVHMIEVRPTTATPRLTA